METENFVVVVKQMKTATGEPALAFHAALKREGRKDYEVVRSGDAQRAYNAAISGAGYVDRHGTYIRRLASGKQVRGVDATPSGNAAQE